MNFFSGIDSVYFNMGLAFVTSLVLSGVIIPQILLIAFRKRLFDRSSERKIHQGAVPRLGGLAFKPVIAFSLFFILGLNLLQNNETIINVIKADMLEVSFGFCAMMLLYLLGIADDLIGVRYRAKFIMQIMSGIFLILGGLYVHSLYGFMGVWEMPKWLSIGGSILLVMFIVNAVNLIDGVDGLASGLSGIAFVYYGIVFFMKGEYLYAIMAFAALGVVVPFFYYNVFGKMQNQKKIFMGDTGSLTVGIMITLLSFKMCKCPTGAFSDTNMILLAFSPMFVPCMDVVRVFFFRLQNHRSPFAPDKNHIHHKLMAIGLSQRQTMCSINLFSLIFIIVNVYLSTLVNVTLLLCIDFAIWILINIAISNRIKKLNKKIFEE